MWEADEKRFLEEVRDAIEKASGKRPRGWMAPWMASTRVTPDLLKETGFDFLMDWPNDDQPIWMKTRSGPLLNVPYAVETNDFVSVIHLGQDAPVYADVVLRQFDEMLPDRDTWWPVIQIWTPGLCAGDSKLKSLARRQQVGAGGWICYVACVYQWMWDLPTAWQARVLRFSRL